MSSVVQACLDWLRQTLRFSNSREAWLERLGFLAVLGMAFIAWYWGRKQKLSYQVLVWSLVLISLAFVMRRGWFKLFGPVLFYDLVRVARRSRYFIIRGVYGFFLLGLLGWIWFLWYMESNMRGFRATEMAEFASSFFYTFMSVQFLVVTILTPAYTASAIADEKERRTLEFILATDLRNREIVLSKLVSRLANIFLLTLVGLPILGFLQFLGGVDPGLVLAGFAATALTVLSLASVSIFFSVMVRRTRDAIALSYMTVLAYVLLSGGGYILLKVNPTWGSFPSFDDGKGVWTSPVTLDDLVNWLNSGNILVAIFGKLVAAVSGGGGLDDDLPKILRDYAIFHGLVALFCCLWAVLRLRAVYLSETYGKPQKGSLGVRLWLRPGVGKHPMLWKEIFAEQRVKFHWVGRILIALLVVASFIWPFVLLYEFVFDYWDFSGGRGNPYYQDIFDDLAENMNAFVRTIGTIVGCLLLLGVAVRAAGSIGGERDKQTLDSLLTSPLDSTTILFGKWVGSILSVRWGWLWLGTVWLLGLMTTGLNFLALPLVLGGFFIYAAFLSILGLWFSMVSKTTLRAIVWTLLTTVSLAVGHWLITMCCVPLLIITSRNYGPPEFFEHLFLFQACGLSPPGTLATLPFQGSEFGHSGYYDGRNTAVEVLAYAVIGLALYAGATALLWAATNARFRQLTGRTPFRRPDFSGPPRSRRVDALDGTKPTRPRKPMLITEEAAKEHVKPASEVGPTDLRGAILVEEEWLDEEEKSPPK